MGEKPEAGTHLAPSREAAAENWQRGTGRSVYRMVVDTVARDVVSGRYGPGDILPTEAVLGQQLGVGRSSVREAMRVLVDKGMLEIRTRTGARVTDRESWRRLDPRRLAMDAGSAARPEIPRRPAGSAPHRGTAGGGACSHRARAFDLSRMETALHAMSDALPGDIDACVDADVAFHEAILAASGNLVLREFEIIIEAALRMAFRLSTSLAQGYDATITSHNDVFEAIRLRDADWASSSMSSLLDVAAADLGLKNGPGASD